MLFDYEMLYNSTIVISILIIGAHSNCGVWASNSYPASSTYLNKVKFDRIPNSNQGWGGVGVSI